MNLTVRIAIVEADQAFRAQVSERLNHRFGDEIIELDSCAELRGALEKGGLDAGIIGIEEGDKQSCEFIHNIHRRFPDFPLAVVADFKESDLALDGLAAGARVAFGRRWSEERIDKSLEQLMQLIREVQASQFSPRALEQVDLKFRLRTLPEAIAPALRILKQLLKGHVTGKERSRIELGLQETLQNAFEHGNLGFTSEEKEELLQEGKFEQAVAEKSEKDYALGKEIEVEISLNRSGFSCVFTDQGKGFDWKKWRENEVSESLMVSGRGITLIDQIFDSVEYNEKGNSVTLSKRFSEV